MVVVHLTATPAAAHMASAPAASDLAAELPSRLERLADLLHESVAHVRDVIPPLVPGGLPEFGPNFLLTLLMAGIVAGAMFVPMRIAWPRLALWLTAVLVPLAYTWSASAGLGTPGCSVGSLPWDVVSRSGINYEVLYNIELLIPAGAAAFLWREGPRRAAALVTALSVPTLIEGGQYLFPQLDRACQLGDVANNMAGVLIGWCLAAGAVTAWRSFVPALRPRHAARGRGRAGRSGTVPGPGTRSPASGVPGCALVPGAPGGVRVQGVPGQVPAAGAPGGGPVPRRSAPAQFLAPRAEARNPENPRTHTRSPRQS